VRTWLWKATHSKTSKLCGWRGGELLWMEKRRKVPAGEPPRSWPRARAHAWRKREESVQRQRSLRLRDAHWAGVAQASSLANGSAGVFERTAIRSAPRSRRRGQRTNRLKQARFSSSVCAREVGRGT
jgi:hypothetical protein